MKKYIAIFLLCIFCSNNCYAAVPTEGAIASPLASYVFHDVDSSIDVYAYGGSCGLMGYGSGTIRITLQYQSTYDGSWKTYDDETGVRAFGGTSTCNFTRDRYLNTPGKYRCKTYVEASVGNHWDDSTVYSPVLTLY